MPRSKPILREEIAVGARLKEVRRWSRLAQTQFAHALGIGRERLSSYENGRALLPYAIGETVCRLWPVNPFWLANGVGLRTARYFLRVNAPPAEVGFRAVVSTLREVGIDLVAASPAEFPNVAIPAGVEEPSEYFDPKTVRVPAPASELEVNNRIIAFQKHGAKCSICGYGTHSIFGKEVQHILEIHEESAEEFVVLCPNCHRLLHSQNPPLKVRELQSRFLALNDEVPGDAAPRSTAGIKL